MRTIIVGVGNRILGDDAVGVHVVNELKKHVNHPDVTIEEASTGGLNLVDLILGYDKAIIIDALKTEEEVEGEVKRITLDELSYIHSCNLHDSSFIEAVKIVEMIDKQLIPKEIIIIGVIVKKQPCEFKEGLSSKISASVLEAVRMTLVELNSVNPIQKNI